MLGALSRRAPVSFLCPCAVWTDTVARLYASLLGRAPEAEGWNGWTNYLLATGDALGTVTAFVTSPEFARRPLTHSAYVTALYHGVLGREPNPGGLADWERVVAATLRRLLLAGFVGSAEFADRLPPVCGG